MDSKHGYGVVRELIGHGIGKIMHEKPEMPNYGRRGTGKKFKEGMVVAIEPMINMGKRDIMQHRDGWTITTIDKKPSAHFEHTIVVTKQGCEVLTKRTALLKNSEDKPWSKLGQISSFIS